MCIRDSCKHLSPRQHYTSSNLAVAFYTGRRCKPIHSHRGGRQQGRHDSHGQQHWKYTSQPNHHNGRQQRQRKQRNSRAASNHPQPRPGRTDDHTLMEHHPVVRRQLPRLRQNHRITIQHSQPSTERRSSRPNLPASKPRAYEPHGPPVDNYRNIGRDSSRTRSATIQTSTPKRPTYIRLEYGARK